MLKEELTKVLLTTADTVIKNIDNDEVRRAALDEYVKRLLDDDIYLSDFVTSVNPRELSVIYISQKLIGDVWGNLAEDASFGMEHFKNSSQFKNFQLNFSYYIKLTLEKQDDKAIGYLYEAIKSYLGLVVELRKLAETEAE